MKLQQHFLAIAMSKYFYLALLGMFLMIHSTLGMCANGTIALPGEDGAINNLKAAGNLLRIVDSFLFTFGARILAGLSILGAGWNLKEQRFALAILCILGAIIMGTVPMWIKNIFSMSGDGGGNIFQ